MATAKSEINTIVIAAISDLQRPVSGSLAFILFYTIIIGVLIELIKGALIKFMILIVTAFF